MPRAPEKLSLAESFDGAKSDYQAAKRSRFRRQRTGTLASGSGADYHYRTEHDFLRIMEDARDMDRSDTIVGATIDRAVDNVIQEGVQLDPKTGDPGLDVELWERWKAWSEDADACDLAGEMAFADMERVVLRSMLLDGDHFALPNQSGALQLIEAHRCRTATNTRRNVVHGVLLDEASRKREAYWFTKDDVDPLRSIRLVSEITEYAARDASGYRQVFHVYDPKRATQTRGVSALAPIFDPCGMFEDINFAAMVKQQVSCCFAIFREREMAGNYTGPAALGAETDQSQPDGSVRRIQEIAPGMEVTGQPGEKLTGFSPNVPNAEFFQHVELILTLISVNLGLPLMLVLLKPDGSFSAYRGAMDQAKTGWKRKQRHLVRKFHRHVYEWQVRRWFAQDPAMRLAASQTNVDLFAHSWNLPQWPYMEPEADARADLLRVRNGLISPRRLHAERGRDYDEIVEETVSDNASAIRRAKREAALINAEFPKDSPVTWREVWSLPTADGIQIALPTAAPAAPTQDKGAARAT